MTDHAWPTDPDEHVWGPWMSHTSTPTKRTQYRKCVHPTCNAHQHREAPKS